MGKRKRSFGSHEKSNGETKALLDQLQSQNVATERDGVVSKCSDETENVNPLMAIPSIPIEKITSALSIKKPAPQVELVPMLLLEDMQSHKAKEVLCAITHLGKLCRHSPKQVVDAVQLGAPSVILISMKHRWRENEAIVAECCHCLYVLIALNNHTERLKLLIMGAERVISKAIRDFPDSGTVHYYGISALTRLFDRADERTCSALSHFCLVDGGVSLVVDTMKKFLDSRSLQHICCVLLTKIVALWPQMASFIKGSEAECAVVAAIKRHPKCRRIRTRGNEFRMLLAKSSPAPNKPEVCPSKS